MNNIIPFPGAHKNCAAAPEEDFYTLFSTAAAIPFGQYKGRTVDEVPLVYALELVSKPDVRALFPSIWMEAYQRVHRALTSDLDNFASDLADFDTLVNR